MNITFQQSGDNGTLAISGTLAIETTEAMKAGIVEAITAADKIMLDLSGVTSLDLCAMQLLCSAHRTATVLGKNLSLISVSEGFSRDMRRAGYSRHVSCHNCVESRCMWLG
jgi:anti-anti-sigma factor